MINDVSGGRFDPRMIAWVKKNHKNYVLTHSRGVPETMSSLAQYEQPVE